MLAAITVAIHCCHFLELQPGLVRFKLINNIMTLIISCCNTKQGHRNDGHLSVRHTIFPKTDFSATINCMLLIFGRSPIWWDAFSCQLLYSLFDEPQEDIESVLVFVVFVDDR